MADWREDFYRARWHLDVAKRMLVSYDEYGGKRFLVGVIREGARASGKLIRSLLIREGVRGGLREFIDMVGLKYLDNGKVDALVGILKVERDQRKARVEFARKDEVLMEVDGKWKILRVSRLKEFINVVDDIISNFPTDIKR